jgi:hypothetical protein
LAKTLQKPHKNLVRQKLLYIFKHSNKQKLFMSTKFHLLLDRSEYATEDIKQLEKLLKKFAISEGEKNFFKTGIVSIEDTSEDTKQELWIENNKYNGNDVMFIHWYNNQLYIIQTK